MTKNKKYLLDTNMLIEFNAETPSVVNHDFNRIPGLKVENWMER